MDDDIDIEEHDVFDNPVIKSIFPDLTVFKKEVFDESYEEYNPEENFKNADEEILKNVDEHESYEEHNQEENLKNAYGENLKNVHTHEPYEESNLEENFKKADEENLKNVDKHEPYEECNPEENFKNADEENVKNEDEHESYEGYNPEENHKNFDGQHNNIMVKEELEGEHIISAPALLVDENLPLNHYSINNSKENNSESDCSESNKVFKSNRIILGSKPNNAGTNDGHCERNIYSATVNLKNISPYLDRCKKYCPACLILFSSREALNVHMQHYHFIQTTDEIKSQNVLELNHENSSEHLEINKPKCNICHKHFATKKSLNKHRRSIHFIFIRTSRINKCIKPKKLIKTKITNNQVKKSNANSCFHCKNVFPNMQSLIEHLYDILQKKEVSKDTDNAKQNLNNLKFHKKVVIDNAMPQQNSVQRKHFSTSFEKYFYRCPICFYYYINEKCSLDHLLNQHKYCRKAPLKKVLFEPKCKVCLAEFKTVKCYNAHIYNTHRKMFTQKSAHSKMTSQSEKKLEDKNTNNLITAETNSVLKDVYDQEPSSSVGSNVGIFKSTLFRCVRCDIHFLNSHTANDHTNHMEILVNWKCSLCHRIFKNIDEHIHKQQHLASDNFTVYGIDKSTIVLYKCLKCEIHFNENSYVQHYPDCENISTNHMKCKLCGLLLDNNIYNVHIDYHKKKSNKASDILIIQTEVLLNNNKDKIILNKDCRELRTRNVVANDMIQNKPQDDRKKHFFTVYYCPTCKCFLNDTKCMFHKKALCADVVPTSCQLCGLVITSKDINSHEGLHIQKKDLTLQDFKFRNLTSRKIISPPIPDSPRCRVCGIYFACLQTKTRHDCGVVDFVKCHVCAKDFSKMAYKLHMDYHNYQIGKHKTTNRTSVSNDNTADIVQVKTEILKTNAETERYIIFTCKNCDLSLDKYDLMVEHCQGHYSAVTNPLTTTICKTCNLKFSDECFERHNKLHTEEGDSVSVIFVKFDLFYFTSDYMSWIKRVFIIVPEDLKQNILNKSIYKYENRIKMKVIQDVCADSTVYKCYKCQCFIDPSTLHKHLGKICIKLRRHPCKICEMAFTSASAKMQHEEVHLTPVLKPYRIVLFNKDEDSGINEALQRPQIWFTLYKCRNCGGVINKENETNHLCDGRYLKECHYCGLLFYRKELRLHLSKHQQVDSFKGENMKVIVIGEKTDNCRMKHRNSLVCMFKGKVCDYLLYKCKSCQICLSDSESTRKHDCTNSIPMKNCSQCGFYFDAKNFDGHNMQHETDCDFIKEYITVIEFDNTPLVGLDSCTESTSYTVWDDSEMTVVDMKGSSGKVDVLVKVAKLYKCPCGLHFIDRSMVAAHRCVCNSRNKISRQQCSKCGLAFSPNVLFKHLLSHHGNKNVSYTFDVIDVTK